MVRAQVRTSGATSSKMSRTVKKRTIKSILCNKDEKRKQLNELERHNGKKMKKKQCSERYGNGAKIVVVQCAIYSFILWWYVYLYTSLIAGEGVRIFKLFFVLFANVLIRITSNWFYVKCACAGEIIRYPGWHLYETICVCVSFAQYTRRFSISMCVCVYVDAMVLFAGSVFCLPDKYNELHWQSGKGPFTKERLLMTTREANAQEGRRTKSNDSMLEQEELRSF